MNKNKILMDLRETVAITNVNGVEVVKLKRIRAGRNVKGFRIIGSRRKASKGRDYNKKIQVEIDKAALMKNILKNALNQVEQAKRMYSSSRFNYGDSLAKKKELQQRFRKLKSEERLLQDKYGDRIAEVKDRAYKDWQNAEKEARQLYFEVGSLKRKMDEAFAKKDYGLVNSLRAEREEKKVDQKCATNIKKIKHQYFDSREWINEVCPEIPCLIEECKGLKESINAQDEKVLYCKDMMHRAQTHLADMEHEYSEAIKLSDSGFKAERRRYLEGDEQLSIKQQLGIDDGCVIYYEGDRLVNVLYGGAGSPDGANHGHIVMDDVTKKIFYHRRPGLDELN